MQIKRYEAENVTQALRAIKAELGPDAVILETRKAGKGGKGVEITAAYEPSTTVARRAPLAALPAERPAAVVDPPWANELAERPRTRAASAAPAPFVADQEERIRAQVEDALRPFRDELATFGAELRQFTQPTRNEIRSVQEQMGQVKALIGGLALDRKVARIAEPLRPLYMALINRGIPRELALNLVVGLEDADPKKLAGHIAARIPVYGPLLNDRKQHRVLFVGPTGAGKTTTIAKLAAHFAVSEGKKVALITLDTFRIGAIEQLSTYARIIGVPMGVAADRMELAARIREYADADLILIDTAGRNPKDHGYVESLKNLDLSQLEVHLALPATRSHVDLGRIIAAYAPLSPSAMVLTKLDEAEQVGPAVHAALTSDIPLSYLANGQKIPEDLHIASGARLVSALFSNTEVG